MRKSSFWSSFWTGETGREIRQFGSDAQLVAIWLWTCEYANAIGLYHFPFPMLLHELDMARSTALEAMGALAKLEFAFFDGPSEVVWVREMARFQLGEQLKATDGRCKGVRRELDEYRCSPFYEPFFDRYGECFHLGDPLPKHQRVRVVINGKPGHAFQVESPPEKDEPPKVEKQPVAPPSELTTNDAQIISEIVGDNDRLFTTVSNWVAHKREKRQAYKPRGLKAVCSQMVKREAEMGIANLEAMVELAMSNNWQGWNFPDKFEKYRQSHGAEGRTYQPDEVYTGGKREFE